ncbi:hypothetical protein CTI12_AA090500 [Artemisia annua]|uniref:Uncharacterized protein n=1 Tax=Artemisia annua TaxID=35608 RepID=A0A2U1PZT8_ARTAN|nr:hypothetical protein CTI12_AA090500 [Artemisia annua]
MPNLHERTRRKPSALAMPTVTRGLQAIIKDEAGITPLTCFSPKLDSWLSDCQKMLSEAEKKSDMVIPAASRAQQDTKHIFQYYFGTGSKCKRCTS